MPDSFGLDREKDDTRDILRGHGHWLSNLPCLFVLPFHWHVEAFVPKSYDPSLQGSHRWGCLSLCMRLFWPDRLGKCQTCALLTDLRGSCGDRISRRIIQDFSALHRSTFMGERQRCDFHLFYPIFFSHFYFQLLWQNFSSRPRPWEYNVLYHGWHGTNPLLHSVGGKPT